MKDQLNKDDSLYLFNFFNDDDKEYKVLQGNLSNFYNDLDDR